MLLQMHFTDSKQQQQLEEQQRPEIVVSWAGSFCYDLVKQTPVVEDRGGGPTCRKSPISSSSSLRCSIFLLMVKLGSVVAYS